MKIIDQTPFRGEDGQISLVNRIQATLKYGMAWYDNIQAQDALVPMLEKQLGKNYILLRNITLPKTQITLPMVLIGQAGIFLINILGERGLYRAKGDEWGTIENEQFKPASPNLMRQTAQMGKALQLYLEKLGFQGVVTVESILLAVNPGAHVETVRPAVRVVMVDALERFAVSMTQARAVLSVEAASKISEVILSGKGIQPTQPVPQTTPKEEPEVQPYPLYETSDDSNRTDLSGDSISFNFEETTDENNPSGSDEDAAAKKSAGNGKSNASRAKKSGGGISRAQWMVLGGAGIFEIIIVIIFIWIVMQNA